MPSTMLLMGVAIFGASVFLILALLVTHGGADKSRQFDVLGDLLSGRHGAHMRGLLIAALAGLIVGALTSFTAVAVADVARLRQCQDICVARGFAKGTIDLSSRPAPRDVTIRSAAVAAALNRTRRSISTTSNLP